MALFRDGEAIAVIARGERNCPMHYYMSGGDCSCEQVIYRHEGETPKRDDRILAIRKSGESEEAFSQRASIAAIEWFGREAVMVELLPKRKSLRFSLQYEEW